jgi:hypothetical protein
MVRWWQWAFFVFGGWGIFTLWQQKKLDIFGSNKIMKIPKNLLEIGIFLPNFQNHKIERKKKTLVSAGSRWASNPLAIMYCS